MIWIAVEEHTFTVDPKKRTRRLPFLEGTALKEPRCRSFEMGTTGNVMVGGWVRWGEPLAKALTQLIPYKKV